MHEGRTVFSQVLDFLPRKQFRKCVSRYRGNHRTRSFTCHDQFLCMAFAQLAYRESLRDTVLCLRALREKLHHVGIQGKVARSTLSDANEKRNWRIYCDFAQVLNGKARKLYAGDDFGLQLNETVYALDSSTIYLCRSVFPWARFCKTKSGVKLHKLLYLRGNIPSFISITDAKVHDVNILDQLIPEPGAIYVMDRAYLDFARLNELNREVFIKFCRRLIKDSDKKIYLILDNLRVHHSHVVKDWVKEHKDEIELFFLPSYSPKLNPDEYLNCDLKAGVHSGAPARSKPQLKNKAVSHLRMLQKSTKRVAKYFKHPKIAYAA